jgi:hypothetical protein
MQTPSRYWDAVWPRTTKQLALLQISHTWLLLLSMPAPIMRRCLLTWVARVARSSRAWGLADIWCALRHVQPLLRGVPPRYALERARAAYRTNVCNFGFPNRCDCRLCSGVCGHVDPQISAPQGPCFGSCSSSCQACIQQGRGDAPTHGLQPDSRVQQFIDQLRACAHAVMLYCRGLMMCQLQYFDQLYLYTVCSDYAC